MGSSVLVLELAKNKVRELSKEKNVKYEGGRLNYEVVRINDDLHCLPISSQITYLDFILNAEFVVQDNQAWEAPIITLEFKKWIKKKLTVLELQMDVVDDNIRVNGGEKNKIFISHSSKDIEIVNAFVEKILQLGLSVSSERIFCTSIAWQGVHSGEYIPDRLKLEIKQSSLALLFISEDYKRSEICLNEVGAAWVSLEKQKVIPILLPGVGFDKLGFLEINRLGLKIDSKKALFQFIEEHKNELNNSFSVSQASGYIDRFLESIKEISTGDIESSIFQKGDDDWTKCFTNNLTPFHKILRKTIPTFKNGIYEIGDPKVQNNIMLLLSHAEFLNELWYRYSDGDNYVEKIKKLPTGNWLISSFNWEVKVISIWVSKGYESQNDFILIRSEKLEPYTINSDVSGEGYEVGLLNDGTIVSKFECENGYAIINGESINIYDFDVELRIRSAETNWVFFGSNYHKVGFNHEKTIDFCRKLDSGEVEVNSESLKIFLEGLQNHPVVMENR